MQLLFESSVENEGGERPRPAGRDRRPARGQRLQGPAHRVVAGPLGARLARSPRAWATRRPFYFVHSFAPRPATDDDVLGTAAYGERFACAVERPPLYGVQFHPEKSSSAGLGLLANFVAHLRLILFPAIDIRDGKAVRLIQGDYDRETAYEDDPVVAARRWVDGGARWLHVVDLDGARAGEPVNLEHVRRIVAAVERAGPARRRPARLEEGRGGVLRRRRAGRPRHRGRPRSGDGGGDRIRARRAGGGVGRLPLGQGRGGGMDRVLGSRRRGGDRRAQRAGRAPFHLHAGRGRRPDGGARPRLPAGGRRRPPTAS